MNRISKPVKSITPKKKSPTPGIYHAVVTAVESPEGFAPNNALDIRYRLTDPKSGDEIPCSERFYIAHPLNERTEKFEEHLDQIGVEDYEDYVGCEVELVFMKEVKNGTVFCNVVDRRLISAPAVKVAADDCD